MAKRVRGNRSTHRPGGQGPSRSKQTAGESVATPSDAAQADLEPGVETIEADYADVTVDETAAAAVAGATAPVAAPPESKRRRRDRRRAKSRPNDLAARAAAEDVWVREDLRRIGIVSIILLVALAGAWVVFVALDVLNLY